MNNEEKIEEALTRINELLIYHRKQRDQDWENQGHGKATLEKITLDHLKEIRKILES